MIPDSVESAIRADLDRLPCQVQADNAGLLALALALARGIDQKLGAPAPNAKELRACLAEIAALTPDDNAGDSIGEFERRRAARQSTPKGIESSGS